MEAMIFSGYVFVCFLLLFVHSYLNSYVYMFFFALTPCFLPLRTESGCLIYRKSCSEQ